MPSSSAVFRSFLVASFKRTKYPSIAALWYLDISKKNRRGLKPLFSLFATSSNARTEAVTDPSKQCDQLGVNVSAAQSHKTKAKSRLVAVHFFFFVNFKLQHMQSQQCFKKTPFKYVLCAPIQSPSFPLCNLTNWIKKIMVYLHLNGKDTINCFALSSLDLPLIKD